MKNFRWDKKYLYWGITAFLVVSASVLFFMFLNNLAVFRSALSRFMKILSPFVWGLVIAYLLCPLMNIYKKYLFVPLFKALSPNGGDKNEKRSRAFAVLLAIISLFLILAAVILLIVPQLYVSIEMLVLNSADYVRTVYDFIDRVLKDFPEVEALVVEYFGSASSTLFEWIRTTLLPEIDNLMTELTSGVVYILTGVYNVIIGIIVSVYVLYNKGRMGAYCKKILYCIFSVEASEKIIEGIDFTDRVFIGFLSGKILDSTIIGILCYIGCMIMNMPYALLVSFVVGITNIIPFFGPFIGAIPSAFIILMVSPFKCLLFVIFIVLLQQLDGNFIGPKILGNSVGINGFWVMFSIIIGSGLFGFMGMLLGVPVFVLIYTVVNFLVNRKLQRSGLPTETETYINMEKIDPRTGEVVEYQGDKKRNSGVKKRAKKSAPPKNSGKAD